jgi:hypothetical protein
MNRSGGHDRGFGLRLGSNGGMHDAVGKAGIYLKRRERLHFAAQRFELVEQAAVGLAGLEVCFDRNPLFGGELAVEIGAQEFVGKGTCHSKPIEMNGVWIPASSA